MSCVPTNKVFFPTRIIIDGKVSYQTFVKKNYKFSKLVKIESPDSNEDGLYKIPKLNSCTRQIAKKIQVLQGLNIVECPSALLQRSSFVLKLIKDFRNIKSLTMPLHYLSKALLQLIIRWLNISKTLKSLSYNSLLDNPIITKQKLSYEKLFRIIKLSKLERLGINLSNSAAKEFGPFLLFTYFPITLKRLSLDWQSPISFSRIKKQSYNRLASGILSRYPNLEALTMKMPIDFNVLLTIFGKDASQFTHFRCLDLHIQDNQLQSDTYSKVAKDFFTKCPNLESASFLFEDSLPSLNFLTSLGICPLRHLFLALPLQDADQMPLLGDSIGNFHHLETLKLKISGNISRHNTSKCFKAFYNSLSQLRSVRILEICILTHTSGVTKISGAVKSLAQLLNNLPCLEELAFKHLQANFVEELGDLLQALSNKVENIKRFEINLENQLLRQNTLMQLVQFIQDLESLETLALDQLTFGKKFTERFSKALIESKSLKVLRLFSAKGKVDSNLLREMIIGILTKPRFESMYFLPNIDFKRIGETKTSFLATGVPVSELLSKNPKLRYVTAPSDIVKMNIDIDICKWR